MQREGRENSKSRSFDNGDSKQLKESLLEISGPGPVVLRPESCVGPASCERVQPQCLPISFDWLKLSCVPIGFSV